MTDPVTETEALPSPRWTAGRIALLVYQTLWSLALGGGLAKIANTDMGIPVPVAYIPAFAFSWWLFGVTIAGWFRPRPKSPEGKPSTWRESLRKAGSVYLRLICSIMGVMITGQAIQEAFPVSPLVAWGGGTAVGVWWFFFSKRFEKGVPAVAFFGPFLLPLGITFAFTMREMVVAFIE